MGRLLEIDYCTNCKHFDYEHMNCRCTLLERRIPRADTMDYPIPFYCPLPHKEDKSTVLCNEDDWSLDSMTEEQKAMTKRLWGCK